MTNEKKFVAKLVEYARNKTLKGFKVFFVINKKVNEDALSLQWVMNNVYTLSNTITLKASIEELLKVTDLFIGVDIRERKSDGLYWADYFFSKIPLINKDIKFKGVELTDDSIIFVVAPKHENDMLLKDFIATVLLSKEIVSGPSVYPQGEARLLSELFRNVV